MNRLFSSVKEKSTVQANMVALTILTSLIILTVNIVLFIYISRAINVINRVYSTNVTIGEMSDALGRVRGSMSEYLNTKSTDSMEQYYDACQQYRDYLSELSLDGQGKETTAILQDIQGLSDTYFSVTDETIQAKRGRVVEKYNAGYERSERIYSYINAYIYSLNNEQFKKNSEKYSALRASLRSLAAVTMSVIVAVALINILLTSVMTKNIMDPVRQREIIMETHLKDAELKYLQAQINPHFLFNTLNAGAQLAMLEDAEKTSGYLQNVAAFFRYRIKGEEKETTLEQEISLVDNYIHILNVRFSGEIHFSKELDRDCLNVSVPGMILQPIVENAVNYGIRNIEREKRIVLKVERLPELIRVRVEDNGVGMSEARIKEVLAGVAGENPVMKDSNGVGIANVMSRLRLFYNREEVMHIFSEGEDRGTIVDILIPVPNAAEEENGS
ncbi:MAG TPA: two-component sensor histidine kinase [Lachnospiraceae bacterium]|nr:two-component sensor histidine kinase [Lachnospiraceae bacterium]HBB59911.1 two-component sensor histidine kinase [Lachnospiraceae bacterium]HCR99724.1 two-component sensor histidine kinase [Lachnospiraceae bacterium]